MKTLLGRVEMADVRLQREARGISHESISFCILYPVPGHKEQSRADEIF